LAEANWVEATQAIQTYDAMVKSPSGYSVKLPYVSIANAADLRWRIQPATVREPETLAAGGPKI
jgi:hypothetical protein